MAATVTATINRIPTLRFTKSPVPMPRFYSFRLQREAVEEAQLRAQPSELAQNDEHADDDQQPSAHHFHGVQMTFEFVREAQEAFDAERGDEEGHGESGGIDGEQPDTFPYRALVVCEF